MILDNVPTIRELLAAAPEKHGDRTFIKSIRDGQIVEKDSARYEATALPFAANCVICRLTS